MGFVVFLYLSMLHDKSKYIALEVSMSVALLLGKRASQGMYTDRRTKERIFQLLFEMTDGCGVAAVQPPSSLTVSLPYQSLELS